MQLQRGRWSTIRNASGRHAAPSRLQFLALSPLEPAILQLRANARSGSLRARAQNEQDDTIAALEKLLNSDTSEADDPTKSKEQQGMVEWWKIRPRQAAPPRITPMSSNQSTDGRFMLNENLLRLGELQVTSKQQLDDQLQLPKVQPILSFVTFLVNLSCYGTYMNVSALQGPEAAVDFMAGLWVHSDLVSASMAEQVSRMLLSLCMAPGPCELVVTLWALAMVAPRAESVMGYWPFLGVYLLSGLAGCAVQLALLDPGAGTGQAGMEPGACGAAAALLGVIGCLAAHFANNWDVESKAAGWRGTPGSNGKPAAWSSGLAGQPPTRQEQGQRLLLVQCVCVAAASLGLAGMQHLSGHPSDPGGGAGLWGEMALSMGVLPQLAGLATGAALGVGMGPRYVLQREVDIPSGSMFIPEDAPEMVIVFDRTTALQRAGTTLAASLGLMSLLAAVSS